MCIRDRNNQPGFKFEKISIDLVGPLPAARMSTGGTEYRWVLTVLDTFTRHLTSIPCESKEARCIARNFERYWLNIYGVPHQIRSDLGTEFTANLVKDIWRDKILWRDVTKC